MNGFELIIFDCDGVLVDSEHIANAELMKEYRLTQAGAHHLFKNMGNLAQEILSYTVLSP